MSKCSKCYLGMGISARRIALTLHRDGKTQKVQWRWQGEIADFLPLSLFWPSEMGGDLRQQDQSKDSFGGWMAEDAAQKMPGLLLSAFVPCLQWAIPHTAFELRQSQPQIATAEGQSLALRWLQEGLEDLFKGLVHPEQLGVEVVGWPPDQWQEILGDLRGIVVNDLGEMSPVYRWNLREALLGARLVRSPDQVYFLSGAIATALALDTTPHPGLLLVIRGDEQHTEMVAFPLETPWADLRRHDLPHLCTAYGLDALVQDLLQEEFLPRWRSAFSDTDGHFLAGLPSTGSTDRPARARASWWLQTHDLGRWLQDIGTATLTLWQRDQPCLWHWQGEPQSLTATVAQNTWGKTVQEQWDRQLNELMYRQGHTTQWITEVAICGSLGMQGRFLLEPWLREKMPQAALQWYGEDPLALGLGRSVAYPELFDLCGHQYHPYFLLQELWTVTEAEPLLWDVIMARLQKRGLNIHLCSALVQNILDQGWPPGFAPTPEAIACLCPITQNNPDYGRLVNQPPFLSQEKKYYWRNPQVVPWLGDFFKALWQGQYQHLGEPLAFTLGTAIGD